MGINKIKQLLKLAMTATVMGSSAVYAADVTDTIVDRYYGAQYADGSGNGVRDSSTDVYGGSSYQVSSMSVTRSENAGNVSLDIKVFTNFAGHASFDGYVYGDLFLTDASNYNPVGGYSESNWFGSADLGQNTRWDYAFDLHNSFGGNRANNQEGVQNAGALVDIDTSSDAAYESDTYTASEYVWDKDSGGRSGQIVAAATNGSQNGYWTVDADDYLSFHIDITNTTLKDSTQIALRWAMTCGNDIIEAVANLTPTTTVPEPAAIILMLSGLAGLGIARRRKSVPALAA